MIPPTYRELAELLNEHYAILTEYYLKMPRELTSETVKLLLDKTEICLEHISIKK